MAEFKYIWEVEETKFANLWDEGDMREARVGRQEDSESREIKLSFFVEVRFI